MEFDLQTYLSEMEKRAVDRHERLESKVDTCLLTIADHETRVTVIEEMTPPDHKVRLEQVESVIKQLKYVVVTVVGGIVTGLIGTLVSYFSGGNSK